jgi:hypothetical protein
MFACFDSDENWFASDYFAFSGHCGTAWNERDEQVSLIAVS